ncbi:aspartyl-phosphate phosphatase Spo0E family protein [Paenibacillus sp. BJ-4]|uniref:aspartyl-phosphate phosphatase Spo0E family protein n=1 Tax=Paenibacillus sp. BJ-4 TaxID=2878097 RepID=UPI001CF03E0A|nr:aspartyl-phosphate phosphatase Spo0E family protein [Paenibacillus sp. BJ-4]
MLMNQGVTLLRVERARRKLYQVQKKYGFLTHPKVIEQSKKLDDLLNLYQLNHYQTSKSDH